MAELLGFLLAVFLMTGTLSLVALGVVCLFKIIPDNQYDEDIKEPGKKHVSTHQVP